MILLAAGLTAGASAQVFRPDAVSGAVWGGLAGAVIGNNSGDLGHNAWRGAAYGSVAGALVGHTVGTAREPRDWRGTQVPPPRRYGGPAWHYPAGYHRDPVFHRENRRVDPRLTGVLLGGLVGAIIGHNDGRHGWEGAAYGVGAGLILGSHWHRAERRAAERVLVSNHFDQEPVVVPVAASAPTNITINNYYTSAPAGANALFGR